MKEQEKNAHILDEYVDLVAQVMAEMKGRRGGFDPKAASQEISCFLDLPREDILSILENPSVEYYPDVPYYLQLLNEEEACATIWTQGMLPGFQELKGIKSGLIHLLTPFSPRVFSAEGAILTGGPDKTDPHVLDPLIWAAIGAGRSIVGVDDLASNLEKLQLAAEEVGCRFTGYQICRDRQVSSNGSFPVVKSLFEIPISPWEWHILDLDRTCIDTDAMKSDWYQRIATLLPYPSV